jgi:thiamine-monophosphate kinase
LLGGDTVRKEGEKFFSVTMIGEVPKRAALLRSGAKVGDDIYVSGKIGEAWVGLQILKGRMREKMNKDKKQKYIQKHYSPEPRIILGRKLLKIANSCTDISDGLLKDLNNILEASEVSAILNADKIPLALKDKKYFEKQITAGDDYQLIFTAKPMHAEKIKKLNCYKIGKIVANNKREKIIVLDKKNKKIKTKRLGYEH